MSSTVTNGMKYTSKLVNQIGDYLLPNGKTVRENLIFKNVNIWDAAQPDLALHILPNYIYAKQSRFVKFINLILKSFKYFLKSIHSNIFKSYLDLETCENIWLFLGSTDYICRDTINPIIDYIKKENLCVNPILSKDLFFPKTSYRKINYIHAFKSITSDTYLIIKSRNEILHLINISNIEKDLDLNKDLFDYIFYWLYFVFLQRNIYNIKMSAFYINLLKPEILISADMSNPLNRICTLIARTKSIPVLEIQFGLYDETSVEWNYFISDKIAVWGLQFKHLFNKVYHIPIDKIIITGSPRFDYINDIKDKKENYILDNKVNVLFASMYTQISSYDKNYNCNLINEFKIKLVSQLSKNNNVNVFIKPHPLENLNWLKNISLNKSIKIIEKREDIRKFISKCDILFTFGSTSTFDAILQNKIVYSANIKGLVWWDDIFLKEKITNPINTYLELENIVKNINSQSLQFINNAIPQNFIDNTIYFPEISSSGLIIQNAFKIIHGKS